MTIRKTGYVLAGLLILAIVIYFLITQVICPQYECIDPHGQVITFWHQHSGAREKIIQEMISNFNRKNEWGINVQGKYEGSYQEIYNKIVNGIPVHQVPEITVAYSNNAAVYAKMGGLIELTPLIHSPNWGFSQAELDDFFPWVIIGDFLPEFNGQYGFPTQRSMEVLYYNKDWLTKLGFDHPPRTWEEFDRMACAASNVKEGKVGYILSVDPSTFADMLFNRNGSLTNADGTSYTFGNQAGLEVLTFLHDLREKGCLSLETSDKQDLEEFGAGRALFNIGSTSSLPDYKKQVAGGADFEWSVASMPTKLISSRVSVYGASLSILRTSKEKQLAAWLFLKWLAAPEQTAYWAENTGYFPVRVSAADLLQSYFAKNPQFDAAFGFLKKDIAVEPGLGSWSECRNSISKMFEAAARGGDPDPLIREAQNECNRVMERFRQGIRK